MKNIPIRYIQAPSNEPTNAEGFSIRDVGDLLAGKDMVQGIHRHDFFYILALQQGTGHHEIDFTAYEVSDRSVFFLRPGQVHQLTLQAGSTGYLMAFANGFYYPQDQVPNHSNGYRLLRKASHTNHYQPDAKRFKKLLSLLTFIFQEYTDKQERYEEVIKANLEIFFIELIRQNSSIPSTQANTYTQERLEKFLELVETHISSHKQVSQYADMLHLSPYQLNAITKTTLGKTGSDLINEYIILESKRYLLATSNQVNQIAYHLGYEDTSYFIRFFKKHTGHSPEAFRYNFR
jgi:AraC family transcriptional regulator, transcriptional activator of pobA